MKKLNPLSLLLCLFLVGHAPAFGRGGGSGSEGGGGGNRLIAEFVATANALLGKVNFTAEEKTLLRDALDRTTFITGELLLDPITKNPLPDQTKLIAWGSPGLIQLKRRGILFDDSFEDALRASGPIAHIVIHELFRASGKLAANGKSIDENFQLSIGKYALDKNFTRGAMKPRRPVNALYAECEVVGCKLRGKWEEGDEKLICEPSQKILHGYLGTKLQVFKATNGDEQQQHDGMVSFYRVQPIEQRLGSQELMAIRILDGIDEMQLIDDEQNFLLDFKIRYSTRKNLTTKGRGTLDYSTPGLKHYVDLEFGNCRTTLE